MFAFFNRKNKRLAAEVGLSMSKWVTGEEPVEFEQIDVGLPEPAGGLTEQEEAAYFTGYKYIEELGSAIARTLAKSFERSLIERGYSSKEARIQFHKFWLYYWTLQVGSTEGSGRRLSLKMTRKHESKIVDLLEVN